MSFALGDRVTVKAKMVPKKAHIDGMTYRRMWERVEVNETKGIIAGVRVVKEGIIEYQWDDGWVFIPERNIKTYLVAVSLVEMWYVQTEDMFPELPSDVIVVEK